MERKMDRGKINQAVLGYAHENFSYNPDSGIVIRKNKTGNKKKGTIVGSLAKNGYLVTNIVGAPKLLHRIIWGMMYGEIPEQKIQIDHIDGDRTNNKWNNLRIATSHNNSCNRGKQKNNTSGYKGVYRNKRDENWQAKLKSKGVNIHIGYFENKIDAALAYDNAVLLHHGSYAKTNF